MSQSPGEAAQRLLDAGARGTFTRRGFLAASAALGLAASAATDAAMAAGEVQSANRRALKGGYDYIVVGSGAAGCIIAAKLAEAGAEVLVVEAGGDDVAAGAQVDDPSIWFTNIGGPLDWAYPTVPSPHLAGRSIPIGAGRVVGGGTSVNASLWVHGHRRDYDDWAAQGCAGWSAADMLPLYRELENWSGPASGWRGRGGPMDVRLPANPHPTAVAWLDASREMGIPVLDDMNAPMRDGAGYTNLSIRPDGSRASASRAFLRPALGRSNLTLLTGATATRLTFAGRRCTGVALATAGGKRTIAAHREVITAAGGVGSAKLLLLSGIGDPEDLGKVGIGCRAALRGVGRNFQDHPLLEGVILRYRGTMPERRHDSDAVEATSFLRSRASLPSPDMQPVLIQLAAVTPALLKRFPAPPKDAFTLAPGLVRPTSRGWVKLASADHLAAPLLDSGFLSTEADLDATVRCIELCREMGRQKAFAAISDGELIPGGGALDKAALVQFARESATSYFHPVGTCRMGTDALAVVGPDLRVHGIDGLRVCDSSIMPSITTGNTNAPTQLIGLKAAAIILASAKLKAS